MNEGNIIVMIGGDRCEISAISNDVRQYSSVSQCNPHNLNLIYQEFHLIQTLAVLTPYPMQQV